jgi:hypothetical protein
MGNTIWTTYAKDIFNLEKEHNVNGHLIIEGIEGNNGNTNTKSNANIAGNNYPTIQYGNSVPNFGNDVSIGDDSDEMILMNKSTPTQTPTQTPTTNESEQNSPKSFKDFLINPTFTDAKKGWRSTIIFIRDLLGGSPKMISTNVGSWFYTDTNSPDAQNDINLLTSQIAMWIALISSYVFVINWWYLWNYRKFKFQMDFKYFILSIFRWSMVGPFSAVEFINYPLVNLAVDENLTNTTQEFLKSMWSYRPIIFSLFHFNVFALMCSYSSADTFAAMLVGESPLFGIVAFLSIFYTLSAFVKESWQDPFTKCGVIALLLVFVGLLIITVIGMILCIFIAFGMFVIYFIFLSNFSLFAFENVNMISKYREMMAGLSDVYMETDQTSPAENVFNQSHNIYYGFMVLSILIGSISMDLGYIVSEQMMVTSVCINVVLFMILGLRPVYSIIKRISNLFSKKPE